MGNVFGVRLWGFLEAGAVGESCLGRGAEMEEGGELWTWREVEGGSQESRVKESNPERTQVASCGREGASAWESDRST